MTAVAREGLSHRFPKSSRLLTSRDFQFRPFKRFQTENFSFVYSSVGRGRLGVSISKKSLRRAVARNRVRRLLREVFRHRASELHHVDLHIVGSPTLSQSWRGLRRESVEEQFDKFLSAVGRASA